VKLFEKRRLLFFGGLLCVFLSWSSCLELMTQPVEFLQVGELCDIRSYVSKFKRMSQDELFAEKIKLDIKEAQEFFTADETYLVTRWLVEVGLQSNLAQASKDALVEYYFERFHKLNDPKKFHVDHPLVVQSRLVKSYRNL
jgi:hypothetical protein